jgi:hypothetical protein
MMVLDHVGDQEAMLYAQLGQHPLARTTATSLEPRRGTLSCLSARPPDLADAAITRPRVVSMFLSIVPFLYSKRTAAARSLVSRYRKANVLWPFQANHSWNYPPVGAAQCALARVTPQKWRASAVRKINSILSLPPPLSSLALFPQAECWPLGREPKPPAQHLAPGHATARAVAQQHV